MYLPLSYTMGWIEFQGKSWRIVEWTWIEGGPHRIQLVDESGEKETLYLRELGLLPHRPQGNTSGQLP